MAAGIILFDANTDPMKKIVRALTLIREGYNVLKTARAIEIQFIDGMTNDAANFDFLADAGNFQAGDYASANAAALASFAEIDSLYTVLTSEALAAIEQACAKHGV